MNTRITDNNKIDNMYDILDHYLDLNFIERTKIQYIMIENGGAQIVTTTNEMYNISTNTSILMSKGRNAVVNYVTELHKALSI